MPRPARDVRRELAESDVDLLTQLRLHDAARPSHAAVAPLLRPPRLHSWFCEDRSTQRPPTLFRLAKNSVVRRPKRAGGVPLPEGLCTRCTLGTHRAGGSTTPPPLREEMAALMRPEQSLQSGCGATAATWRPGRAVAVSAASCTDRSRSVPKRRLQVQKRRRCRRWSPSPKTGHRRTGGAGAARQPHGPAGPRRAAAAATKASIPLWNDRGERRGPDGLSR